MHNLTPWEVCVIVVGAILAVAAAVNTIGSAVEKISKARNAAKAPNEEQDRQIKELQEWRKEVDRRLEKGNIHFDAIDASDRVTKLALLALLDTALTATISSKCRTPRRNCSST